MAGQLVKPSLTLDECFEKYREQDLVGKNHEREWARKWEMHVSPIVGHMLPEQISYDDILPVRQNMVDIPVAGNDVIMLMRCAFVQAQRRGQVPPGNTVMNLLPKHKVKNKQTFLTIAEVKDVIQKARELRPGRFAILVRALILTGARYRELSNASSGELVDDTTLMLPVFRSKTKESRPIYPPQDFINELRSRPGARPFHEILTANRWGSFRKAAGYPELKVHDLRRVVGTLAMHHAEAKLEDVSALLGHSNTEVTKRYTQTPDRSANARDIVSRVGKMLED